MGKSLSTFIPIPHSSVMSWFLWMVPSQGALICAVCNELYWTILIKKIYDVPDRAFLLLRGSLLSRLFSGSTWVRVENVSPSVCPSISKICVILSLSGYFGAFWPYLAHFEAILGHFRPYSVHFEVILGHFRPYFTHLEPFWGYFG